MSRQLHSYPYRRLLLLLCLSLSAHFTSSTKALRKRMEALADDRLVTKKEQAQRAQQETNGIESRIINGQLARVGRFDYFVHMVGSGKGCGGALVAPDIVISAAHCKFEALLETADIGTYDRTNLQEGHPTRLIEEMFIHPSYTGEIPYDDIMVVKLASPAPAGWQLLKMNLDPNLPSVTGQPLTSMGYGATTTPPPYTGGGLQLMEAQTEYVAYDDCAVARNPDTGFAYGETLDNGFVNTAVTGDWFCTLINNPRTATCVGDSGGPIILEGATPDDDLLVASVSGGSGDCGNPYLPDLNQRTSFQAEWILSVACAESVDPPDYWDCPGVPKPPTERPLPEPTPRPTVPPTPRPTVSPTPRPTVSPTPRPTTARATPRPTPQRTMGGRTTPAPVQPGDNPTAPDTTPPPANGAPVGLPQPNRPPTAILVDNTLDPTMRPTLESSSDGSGPAPAPAGDPTDAPIVQRIPVNIVIDFDENPQEIGWYITDDTFRKYRVQVPMGAYLKGTTSVVDTVYLKPGTRYVFVIQDKGNDGLSSALATAAASSSNSTVPITGSYKLLFEGQEDHMLVRGSSNFGTQQSSYFTMPYE